MIARASIWPQWLVGIGGVGAAAAWIVFVTSCRPPPPRPPAPTPTPADAVTLSDLSGTWDWRLESDVPGVHRIERERWHLEPDPSAAGGVLVARGAYDRDVELRSTDGVPFVCDEDGQYHQRTRYQVRAEVRAGAVTIKETGYDVAPGPCDRGFRRTGDFRVQVGKGRLVLRWDGGEQTLLRGPATPMAEVPPWRDAPARWDGAWTWFAHTMDDDGNLRDEREDWQVAIGADGLASATYVRTVTVTSIDGRPIACSGTRRWSFVDRYVLDGHLDGSLLTLTEVAVDAGGHPCLATSPRRSLDGLTAQQDGDYLELEWRGKRRQVLHRPR